MTRGPEDFEHSKGNRNRGNGKGRGPADPLLLAIPQFSEAAEEVVSEKLGPILYLTQVLSPKTMGFLLGPEQSNLEALSTSFSSLPFLLVDSRIAVEQADIDHFSVRDPGLQARLTNVLFSLAGIAEKGKLVTQSNIEQAYEVARRAQKSVSNGIVSFTRSGNKIDITDRFITELENNALFEPYVREATCVEDPDFTPSLTLFFSPTGKALLSRVASNNGIYLAEIKARTGVSSIVADSTDGPAIVIKGARDNAAIALSQLVDFCGIIATQNFKKTLHLEMALRCALGELRPEQLPDAKTSTNHGAREIFSPALMTVNELTPKTENQQRYVDLIMDDNYGAVMMQGPAGTGKTRLFLQVAMRKIRDHYRGVSDEKFDKLILSIPLVNVGGQKIGSMPGGLESKTNTWFDTYYRHLERILAPVGSTGTPDLKAGATALEALMKAKVIEIAPLEFLRGKSFDNALFALDEAQNATAEQTKTFLTRAEDTSRLFMFGDLEQTDRGATREVLGEPFLVPSTVQIDDMGTVFIEKQGKWMEVGFHKDLGRFVLGARSREIEKFYPRNGFAQAIILYSSSPYIACTCLDHSDIQRNGVARDLLVLHRGLRIPGGDGLTPPPFGVGKIDPLAILTESTPARVQRSPKASLRSYKP